MDPLTMAAIMGGVGLLQGGQQDKQAREQMKLNAMQQRFAPLFGNAPGAAQMGPEGEALRGGLSGALGGYQTGLNFDMMKNAMMKAQGSPQGLTEGVAMNTRPQNSNPYGGGMGGSSYA